MVGRGWSLPFKCLSCAVHVPFMCLSMVFCVLFDQVSNIQPCDTPHC
jgi:hypothetical protein